MYFIYNLVWTIAAIPFFSILFLYVIVTKRKKEGLPHFFGLLRKNEIILLNPDNPTIWVHAVSVGEIKAVLPIIETIKRTDLNIVVSTTTQSGYYFAKKTLPKSCLITYSPIDFFLTVMAMMKRISPKVVVVTETGVWPNLAFNAKRYNASLFIIHGRISKRSYLRYMKIRPAVKKVFNKFDRIFMQNEYGVKQLIELGVNPYIVSTAGDTKFDSLNTIEPEIISILKKRLNLSKGILVLIGGSTHEGEEDVMIDIFEYLRKRYNKVILIIAPRRLERVNDVSEIIRKRGLRYEKISEMTKRKTDICLVDTMGELAALYSIGDIIFVGRSLFPPGGGHSLLEPAAYGKAVFHGHYMEYNREIASRLKDEGIAIEVKDEKDLREKIGLFIKDNVRKQDIERRALAFIKKNSGASRHISEVLLKALKKSMSKDIDPNIS